MERGKSSNGKGMQARMHDVHRVVASLRVYVDRVRRGGGNHFASGADQFPCVAGEFPSETHQRACGSGHRPGDVGEFSCGVVLQRAPMTNTRGSLTSTGVSLTCFPQELVSERRKLVSAAALLTNASRNPLEDPRRTPAGARRSPAPPHIHPAATDRWREPRRRRHALVRNSPGIAKATTAGIRPQRSTRRAQACPSKHPDGYREAVFR